MNWLFGKAQFLPLIYIYIHISGIWGGVGELVENKSHNSILYVGELPSEVDLPIESCISPVWK